MGSLMTSSSLAGPIQISKFPEPWCGPKGPKSVLYKHIVMLHMFLLFIDLHIKIKGNKVEYSDVKRLPRGHIWGSPEVKK